MSKHVSVLLHESIEGLNIKPDGIYVDMTLGRGGHSLEILKQLTSGKLIAIDQDIDAINESKIVLKNYLEKVTFVRDNFSNIDTILDSLNIECVDGILGDLGVSSPQFDEGERGFSYRFDAPLDMRMDQRQSLTAKEIVNTYSLNELTRIFREYGEERFAFQISKNIVANREKEPIITTLQLVEIIKHSKPMKELNKAGHPAKQVFQALRIAVNDELNVLSLTVKKCLPLLKKNGRLAIITFHSLEDRIVKQAFVSVSKVIGDRLNIPTKQKEADYKLITTHPIIPSELEMEENHRSKSAKLRIIERK